MAYFRELGADCSSGGSAEIITKYAYSGGTVVPNTGTIDNIYWNISLTMEEISTIIQDANLTYADFDGLPVYGVYAVFSPDGTTPLSLVGILDGTAMIGAPAYAAIDMVTESMLFCTSELLAAQFEGMGLVGWNSDLVSKNGNVSIVGTLLPSLADMGFGSVGAENDKLINLFSASEYTKNIAESIPLTGAYDGRGIKVIENGAVDIKTLLNEQKMPLEINVEVPSLFDALLEDHIYELTSELLSNVTSIRSYSFCWSQLKKVEIPSNIEYINASAFGMCHNLSQVTISEEGSIRFNGFHVFENCPFEAIHIPNSVKDIGGHTFRDCANLKTITFGAEMELTYFGEYLFNRCSSLEEITVPDSVTRFARSTFSDCSALKKVKMSKNLTTLAEYIFLSCKSLELCDFRESTAVPTLGDSAFYGVPDTCKIVVPDALYDEWIVATNWSNYASKIVKASEYTE